MRDTVAKQIKEMRYLAREEMRKCAFDSVLCALPPPTSFPSSSVPVSITDSFAIEVASSVKSRTATH